MNVLGSVRNASPFDAAAECTKTAAEGVVGDGGKFKLAETKRDGVLEDLTTESGAKG